MLRTTMAVAVGGVACASGGLCYVWEWCVVCSDVCVVRLLEGVVVLLGPEEAMSRV